MVGVSLRSEKICRTGRFVPASTSRPQRPHTITEQGRASARTSPSRWRSSSWLYAPHSPRLPQKTT